MLWRTRPASPSPHPVSETLPAEVKGADAGAASFRRDHAAPHEVLSPKPDANTQTHQQVRKTAFRKLSTTSVYS